MTGTSAATTRRYRLLVPLLLVAIVAAGALSLVVGAADQPAREVVRALGDGLRQVLTGTPYPQDGLHIIVLQLRLPRVILAALVGICLALAGAIMQALFQNALADPYLVGVSSGAGLGAVVAIMLGVPLAFLGLTAIPLLAFIGALGVVFLVYVLARRGGRVQTGTLLLTGIAVGSLVSAVTSFLMMVMQQDLRQVLFWLLGGLSGRGWQEVWVILPQAALGLGAALVLSRPLNMLLLGDEAAASLGMNIQTSKRLLLALASLLAAGAVAVSGVIAFVGLVVPHVTRLAVGPDHRRLLPVCALSGALLMILSDIAARVLLAPTELPIGIITSALGCPFFLYLLHRQGGRGL
ncbi:MAG: FecCD family ABC transporter permease [Armatimonadota bacterium]